jgi:two-component system, NarL family, response regulator NreC
MRNGAAVQTGTREPTDLPLDSLADLGSALSARPYARRGVPASDTVIRVALVDDHTIVRDGIRALLSGVPDIKVVGEGQSGADVLEIVDSVHPDVVVMDIDMPKMDGIEATRALAGRDRAPRVLILSMHSEDKRLIKALEAGASGYLMKDAAEQDLLDAIRTIARDEVYVRPRVARMLAASIRPAQDNGVDEAAEKLDKLSDRERSVLQLVAEGYNGPEIGKKLGITARTVDTYKKRIETKVGLTHRTDYVRFALSAGMLKG